jgi:1-acyl-sn-glycerol-3-phosphate acyltransferase
VSNVVTAPAGTPSAGWIYWGGQRFFRVVFAGYFGWRYFNRERVPLSGPVILAANHISFIDPPLVGAPLPRAVCYLARDTAFRFPVFGWLLRRWNAVPVDRDGGGASGLRRMLEALESGNGIVIFPEGTRSSNGRLQPARAGVGLLVLKTEAPVVPVRVFGTFEAFGRHMRLPRPNPVAVKYGKPLWFESLRAESRACEKARLKEIYQQIGDEIMAAISALQPHEDHEQFPIGL